MGVQLITDFNPTHKMYAVGDEKHTECLMEGTFGDNFDALVPMTAKLIHCSAKGYAKSISEEEKAKIRAEHKGKTLTVEDIGVIVLWNKFSDDVCKEFVKLKVMDDIDIPDFIKETIPKEVIEAFVSDAMKKLKEETENE